MSNLIIVESPTKARTLSRFLGKDFRIEASMGHVRDLPEKKLGIDITKLATGYSFKPHYQVIASRKQKIKEICALVATADRVTLATDPDREGEAIAYHVQKVLLDALNTSARKSKDAKKIPNVQRIVFHEITQTAIRYALDHPRQIDMQLVDAQQARRILDRLVGYKLSPLLWNKLGKRWLSAGRVQSVAVRLIVEREREIEDFHPEEYWQIDVELEKEGARFLARLVKIANLKADIKNKNDAQIAVADLKRSEYLVKSVEKKEVRRYPSPPFTTSTLQQAASNRFGWSAKRTMQTAQKLYEEGYITYHRTDSTNLSNEAVDMVRAYIRDVYGDAYLPQAPKFYKTKSKVAQEAHEAIRPTGVGQSVQIEESIAASLGREAVRLYDLIEKKFIACQMNEARFDQTTAEIEAKAPNQNYLLKSTGTKMVFDGYLRVYLTGKSHAGISDVVTNGDTIASDEKILPAMTTGDVLTFIQVIPEQKFTEPPPRYTEATLIKALEEKGIGRPSTYAPIISTIQDRKYVEKIERKFHPTDLGKTVNDFLVGHFPDIFEIGFTAALEEELDDIANGKFQWEKVVSDFYSPFSDKLEKVFKNADRVKLDLGTTDEKCPKCKSPLAIRLSKFGKFLACTSYPACTFTKNMVEKAGIACPRCKGDIAVKKTRRGKQFYGCVNYPTCTFAAWKKEDIK